MALIVQAHSELEWPKTCSQGSPLVYAGSIILRLTSHPLSKSKIMKIKIKIKIKIKEKQEVK